jgi:hypothetical protein
LLPGAFARWQRLRQDMGKLGELRPNWQEIHPAH